MILNNPQKIGFVQKKFIQRGTYKKDALSLANIHLFNVNNKNTNKDVK